MVLENVLPHDGEGANVMFFDDAKMIGTGKTVEYTVTVSIPPGWRAISAEWTCARNGAII